MIARNPCVIKGASVERPAERPVATIEQVYAIADAIEPRYRAMVLLATFCGLRVGELLNLDDVLETGKHRVTGPSRRLVPARPSPLRTAASAFRVPGATISR